MSPSDAPPLTTLSIFCDGSGFAKPGLPGGWAYLIVVDGVVVSQGCGAEKSTTNNRMEMVAAIEGLKALGHLESIGTTQVELVSDSRHCLDVAAGRLEPSKDLELTVTLRELAAKAQVSFRWVRGHSGDAWNERCDAMALEAKRARIPARVRRKQDEKNR